MNKDIKYNGYSAQPSDYECPDGDLAMSLNLINEDGRLKGIGQPSLEKAITATNADALFIHKTNEFTHYIIKSNVKICWVDEGDSVVNDFEEYYYNDSISHVNALGNTLMVFTESGINYYLWKDNAYKFLGDHVPDIGISFGLVGHPRLFSMADDSASTFKITFAEGIPDGTINSVFSEKNRTSITSQVMAKVNKFIANETVNKGRFCFPFFVRYALRLFDGSIVGHSAPILMNPSTTACPVVLWNRLKGKKANYTEADLDIMLVAATLDYKLNIDEDDYALLPDWSDIIKSIDVFISKPLYSFDQEGLCSSFGDSDDFESRFIGRLYHKKVNTTSGFLQSTSAPQEDSILGPVNDDSFIEAYSEWNYSYIYGFYFNQSRSYPSTTLHLPEFSDDKRLENLRNAATFYKLCSIDTNTLYENRFSRTDITIEDEYLQSLVTREVMTDDYLSHDHLRADSSYCYNSRINLSGVKRKLFKGFSPASLFAYVSPQIFTVNFNSSDNNKIIVNKVGKSMPDNSLTVFIKENGKEYQLNAKTAYMYGTYIRELIDNSTWVEKTYIDGKEASSYEGRYKYHWPSYFFYPNVNAYRIAVNCNNEKFYIDLKPHEFLNGAYAVLDYNNIRQDNSADFTIPSLPVTPALSDVNVVSVPNKVYTSEVNNPFFFPLLGINTVGNGNIMGLCTAAKALSQGQFGQFPLYAFTDEGVWAMEVSSSGSYSAKQPITRDVCINPKGITQIDSAVLFPTDRGIMLISGSQTQCISDTLNCDTPFNVLELPGMQKLHAKLGHANSNTNVDNCLPIAPFSNFLKTGEMIYDYVHQRIILYNKGYTYAYVYSLKTQMWGMMYTNIKSSLNSYPEALAVDNNNNIVNFSLTDDTPLPGLLVTRPLKLDAPDILKTVDTVIQRGNFRKGHVQSVLYGSRDLQNWHLVWSSKDHYLRGFRGSPYKYFRIALLCNLSPDESIFGASLQFTPRHTNQPR